MAERVGFAPLVSANSLTVNKIAATIEYNRLADFATKSINSTAANVYGNIDFVGTPWTPQHGREMDTIQNPDAELILTATQVLKTTDEFRGIPWLLARSFHHRASNCINAVHIQSGTVVAGCPLPVLVGTPLLSMRSLAGNGRSSSSSPSYSAVSTSLPKGMCLFGSATRFVRLPGQMTVGYFYLPRIQRPP